MAKMGSRLVASCANLTFVCKQSYGYDTENSKFNFTSKLPAPFFLNSTCSRNTFLKKLTPKNARAHWWAAFDESILCTCASARPPVVRAVVSRKRGHPIQACQAGPSQHAHRGVPRGVSARRIRLSVGGSRAARKAAGDLKGFPISPLAFPLSQPGQEEDRKKTTYISMIRFGKKKKERKNIKGEKGKHYHIITHRQKGPSMLAERTGWSE